MKVYSVYVEIDYQMDYVNVEANSMEEAKQIVHEMIDDGKLLGDVPFYGHSQMQIMNLVEYGSIH